MDTIGILSSLALQYGVSIEALAGKFEYARFEPSGWTANGEIRRANSVVDYVFRWLGQHFSESYRRTTQPADGGEVSGREVTGAERQT